MGNTEEAVGVHDRPPDLSICPYCGAQNVGVGGYCGFCGKSASGLPAPVDLSATPGVGLTGTTSSDATRYICAAVHRNWLLRERIVHEVINETYKAPPRSPDVDLIMVVAHTIAARRRRAICNLLLTILGMAGLVFFLLAGKPSIPVVVAFIGVAWVIGVAGHVAALYGPIAQRLRPHGHNADPLPTPRGPLRTRISSLQQAVEGNVTVYGDYDPFFGSGVTTGSWSFPLDRLRAAEGKAVQPFNAQDIHDFMINEVATVGLPHVEVEDRVFVDGHDLVDDRRFIQHRLSPPSLHAAPDLVRYLRIRPEDKVRPYACFYVKGWSGQLVASTYLRFVVTRRHLFVEVTNCLLPPIKERYQKIDRAASRPRIGEMVQIGALEILCAPFRLLLAPLLLLYFMARPWNQFWHTWRERREIKRERAFNYGNTFNPRQKLASRKFQRYFQRLDSDQYVKIVEKNILRSLVDFLDAHGIDTAELDQRQTTILNNGVYVTGSATVNATNVAAGKKAKAATESATLKK